MEEAKRMQRMRLVLGKALSCALTKIEPLHIIHDSSQNNIISQDRLVQLCTKSLTNLQHHVTVRLLLFFRY